MVVLTSLKVGLCGDLMNRGCFYYCESYYIYIIQILIFVGEIYGYMP